MSARMSSIGCGVQIVSYKSSRYNAYGNDIIYLGNSAVVDLDEVAGSRVDLETLIESERGIDHLRSYIGEEIESAFVLLLCVR